MSKLNFRKFGSIVNHYDEVNLDYALRNYANKGDTYSVTEKLHGSNFGFIVQNDGTVKFQSRNQLTDENFQGAADAINATKDALLSWAKDYGDGSNYYVYGELIGPGIQKGVDYGTVKSYRVFDVWRVKGDNNEDGEWLSIGEIRDTFLHTDIKVVPVIAYELSLEKALTLSEDFDSLVFESALDKNPSEGLVIKSNTKNADRVLVKKKSAKFAERCSAKKSHLDNNYVVPDELKEVYEECRQRITENRLDNAKSHFDTFTPKLTGPVLKEFNQDVTKPLAAFVGAYGKGEIKKVSKVLTIEASKFATDILFKRNK